MLKNSLVKPCRVTKRIEQLSDRRSFLLGGKKGLERWLFLVERKIGFLSPDLEICPRKYGVSHLIHGFFSHKLTFKWIHGYISKDYFLLHTVSWKWHAASATQSLGSKDFHIIRNIIITVILKLVIELIREIENTWRRGQKESPSNRDTLAQWKCPKLSPPLYEWFCEFLTENSSYIRCPHTLHTLQSHCNLWNYLQTFLHFSSIQAFWPFLSWNLSFRQSPTSKPFSVKSKSSSPHATANRCVQPSKPWKIEEKRDYEVHCETRKAFCSFSRRAFSRLHWNEWDELMYRRTPLLKTDLKGLTCFLLLVVFCHCQDMK